MNATSRAGREEEIIKEDGKKHVKAAKAGGITKKGWRLFAIIITAKQKCWNFLKPKCPSFHRK